MKRLNIHLYQSPITHESRMLRISDSLAHESFFDEIHIIGLHEKGLKKVDILDDKRKIIRIKNLIHTTNPESRIRYLTLAEWNLRIFFIYIFQNVVAINPHSVPSLPVAFLFKFLRRSLLIYDTHEIETEQYTKNGLTKKLSKIFEKFFIKKVDHIFVTSDGYGEWYKAAYNIKEGVTVVKNFPYKRDLSLRGENRIRNLFKLKDDDIIFIYQGLIAYGRGLELLIEVFKGNLPKKHIVFMGYGPQAELVKQLSANNGSHIHFMPAVRPNEVHQYVMDIDVGFCLIENSFISYQYTLPNKLLEALNVGVPVVVSNFPDMAAVIHEYQSGWVIPVEVTELLKLVTELSPGEIAIKKNNATKWANENSWSSEAARMVKVYSKLLKVV